MKRTLSLLMAALMVMTLLIPFTAQATSIGEHTHKWVSTDTAEATCTEPGKVYEYCSICQAWRERTVPAKGHHFPPEKWQTTKAPTCTEPGQEKNYCSRVNYGRVCNYEWRRELPALGHDWGEWYTVKEAKPGEPGLEERKCARCGITEQRPLYAEEGEASVFLNVYIPDEQPTYGEGENIPYVCEVTNNSEMPLYIQWIYYYEPSGANGYVPSTMHVPIAAHETLYFYNMTHQVTKADLDSFSPDFPVRFQVSAFKSEGDYGYFDKAVKNNGWVNVIAHIGDATPEKGELTLTKSVLNEPANGMFFTEDEEIQFFVKIKNTGSVPLYDAEVIEYPSGWTGWENDYYTLGKFAVLEPDSGNSYTVKYTVKAKDCDNGSYTNQVQAIGYTQQEHGNDYDTHAYAEAEAPTGYDGEDIGDMELIVEKTIKGYDPEGETPSFTENDTVTFCIDVSNAQAYPLYNVVITDKDSSGMETVLGSFDVFAPHQSEHYEIAHVFSYEECEAGVYTNTAIGEWFSDEAHGDSEDPNWIDDSVQVELWYELGDMEMMIEKHETSTPANGSYYVEGETIYYQIDAWNSQGYPLYNVEIWDVPYDTDGMRLGEYAEFGPHQIVSFEYKHEVTAEDCAQGRFINGAVVGWQSESGLDEDSEMNWLEATDVESPCGKSEGVVITKKVISTPTNGKYYVEGEEIQYEVRVDNYTGAPLHDFWLHDTMVPDEKINPSSGLGDLVSFVSATYSYTVTHEDAVLGSVINTASATWYDDDKEPHSKYSETLITPTGEEAAVDVTLKKKVVSTSADPNGYAVGETVTYEITLINNSDLPLADVEIVDPIKGNNEDAIVDIIPTMEPHTSLVYQYQYEVRKEDAVSILNQASAAYLDSASDEIKTVYSNIVTVDVLEDDPSELTPDVVLIKSVTSVPEKGFYQKDEVITYELIFVNNNDYPLYNIGIYDELYSDTAPVATVSALGPKESYGPVTFTYTVQDKDIAAPWCIVNQAMAVYFLEEDDEDWGVFSNVLVVPTGEEEPPREIDFSFSKTVVSTPANGYYVENETVAYLITLVNNSDAPLYIGQTYDELYNTNTDIITNLGGGVCAPHESFTLPYSYTVTKADVEAGYITNYAAMDIIVQDAMGNAQSFYPWDEVTVTTGEGVPDPIEQPAVVKYVVSTPKSGPGGPYVKDEVVEYDIYVYNYTPYAFENLMAYDILSVDTGFFVTNLGDLGPGEFTKFHVTYTVTAEDIGFDIYNIAWVTMSEKRSDEQITVYSNEVTVPTVGEPPVTGGQRTVCEYKLVASGDGADEYMNVYCDEHGALHEAVEKLLSSADSPEKKLRAQEVGLRLYERSLEAEYERLIASAQGELKQALEADRIAFTAYVNAYRERLKAEGKTGDELFNAVAAALNDRLCELCYTQGHAPQTRSDLRTADIPVIQRRSAAACSCAFDVSQSEYFTKSLNVCDKHAPLLTAIGRLFTAAQDDEAMLLSAWSKAAAFWKADLEGKYTAAVSAAEGQLKHCLTIERVAYLASVATREKLYSAYYPDSALTAAELTAQLLKEKAVSLCR